MCYLERSLHLGVRVADAEEGVHQRMLGVELQRQAAREQRREEPVPVLSLLLLNGLGRTEEASALGAQIEERRAQLHQVRRLEPIGCPPLGRSHLPSRESVFVWRERGCVEGRGCVRREREGGHREMIAKRLTRARVG